MRGFSLVELSIVLVILGLLTGGILAGQSLIRASELRSVPAQMQSYQTAIGTFRDKYFAVPGDMRNATSFWGDDNANCPDAAIANGTPGTCNGNSDGLLNYPGAANATGEIFQFWKQLALAGLVEGSYSGLAGGGGTRGAWPGFNVPRGKISNAAVSMEGLGNQLADTYRWDGAYGNTLYYGTNYGGATQTTTQHPTEQPVMTPAEVWNIDTKMDDGKPAFGKLRTHKTSVTPNCTTTNVEATADYNVTHTSAATGCGLLLITGY